MMSSMHSSTSSSKSCSLQRPRTLFKEPNVNIKSLSLKTESNDSNNHITRKSSFKQKFFSIFKTSKYSQQNSPNDSYTIEDSNSRYYSQLDNSHLQRSQSTCLNSHMSSKKLNCKNKHDSLENKIKRLDSGDRTLIDKFDVHQLNIKILQDIMEFNCTPINWPKSWKSETNFHISNSMIIPFISTIPGLLGIENHGNTCYVNVIIQCLAHIDSVAEYFSTKDYLQHVKIDNPLSQAESATGFDVMVAFSYLLQSLWQTTYQSKISMKFCQMLTMHKTEFRLDSQQDAHELLLFILNLLHDNLVQKIPKIEKPFNDYSDPITTMNIGELSDETSFIYQRFRGLLSNEIVCPECRYTRKTLDQILSLNLQIPKPTNQMPLSINKSICHIIVINPNQLPEKHALEITNSTTVGDVRQIIANRLGCMKIDIVIVELNSSGFGKSYSDNDEIMPICKRHKKLMSEISDYCNGLYATCIPNQVVDVDALQIDIATGETDTRKKRKEFPDNQPFIRILVVHVEKTKESLNGINDEMRQVFLNDESNDDSSICEPNIFFNENHYLRFTDIMTVQAARKTKISLLRHSLSEQMYKYLNLRNITKLPRPQFIIGGSHLITEMEIYPLTHPSVNKDLLYTMKLCGEESAHVRMVVVWPIGTTDHLKLYSRKIKEKINDNLSLSLSPHKISNHSSVEELELKFETENADIAANHLKSQNKIHITDCLREFFSLDTLSITESWKCPNCSTSQPARTEIRIEEAPDVLILMLKRFSKQQSKSTENLSENRSSSRTEHIRKHMSHQTLASDDYKSRNGTFTKPNSNKSRDSLNKLECLIKYPLKDLDLRPYMENALADTNYLYDLVGVVNHRGSLFNGHYVAICHNSIDNRWRLFDDDRVTDLQETDVVTPDAYILFYKRQKPPSENLSNIHWSYRRLTFPEKVHRNHSPSPTSLYSRPSRYTEKEIIKSIDSYSSFPLSITNNHSSRHSLIDRTPSESHVDHILSPRIASSEQSIISSSIDGCIIDPIDSNTIIDVSKIRSEIIDVDSLSLDSSMITDHSQLKTTSSNDSGTKSLNEDSGTALSQDFRCQILRKKHRSSVDNNSKDECYNSFSTSPSTSSPTTSNTC